MSQTREFIVCFDFVESVDIHMPPGDALNQKLRDAVVVEASTPFAKYLGFKDRDALIGKHMMDLFKDVVPRWFVGYGAEVADTGFKDLERVIEVPIGGGAVMHARIYMQNIIEKGRLTRQWVTVRNVTAEAKQKQELETSERTKGLALEAANLRTFDLDFGKGEVNVDPAGLGAIASETKSLTEWLAIVDSSDLEQVRDQLDAFRSGKIRSLHSEFRVAGQSGESRWIEAWGLANRRDAEGRPSGVTGVYRDTTESRQLELKMRSVQKLETLGMLAGGIAHDFNNLLMTIMGSSEVARAAPEELPDALQRIEEASERAAQLCNQLLAYAGKGTRLEEDIDLAELVERMLGLLSVSAGKNTRLRLRASDPVFVRGDASQLGQVVMNLVQNASEALSGMPGEIHVEVGRTHLSETRTVSLHSGFDLQPGEHAYVEVEDTGVGMTAEELEHLFDPFFTTKFTGRGLGLAVVFGVIAGHRGGIEVQSERGSGTRIRALIPCVEAPEPKDVVIGDGSQLQMRGCILVVDDEPSVLRTVEKMLKSLGLEVETAACGAEAIRLVTARHGQYDAILVDMTMPELDGPATASRILDLFPDSKAVLTSGYTDQNVPAELKKRVDFIQKPYRIEHLARALGPILDSEAQ